MPAAGRAWLRIGARLGEPRYASPTLMTFDATHSGSSSFVIYILDDSTGAEVTSIVNEIGKVDETKAVQLKKSGTYAVQVQADDYGR